MNIGCLWPGRKPKSVCGYLPGQAFGTASRTERKACAAPSSAALSNGTTILVLSLSANLASVSSCRIAISEGSGLAARIAS